MMKKRSKQKITCFTALFIAMLLLCLNTSYADTIVFKDGTKMEVKTAWQEGNQVKTEKYGGIVSYPMSKIERIVKGEYNYLEENNKSSAKPQVSDKVDNIPEFIKIKSFSTKIIESSDDFVYVSWEARIFSEKAGKILISINFRDRGNGIINKDLKEAELGLGENTVTDMTMVKTDMYKKVQNTGISIKEE